MNRRDDDLTDIPQMKPARDEVVGRRSAAGSTSKSRHSDTRAKSAGGGLWMVLTLLIAVSALGASYFLWEQSRQTQMAAIQAESRIAELEAQLTSTGDELTQSDAAVRVKLKELDTEVRKLWDSRKKANKVTDSQAKTIKNLTTRSGETRKKADSLIAQLTVVSAELDEVVDMLDSADFESQSAQLQRSAEKLQSIESKLTSMQNRIVANEEWIESINAFRRQVNERLNPVSGSAQTPQLQ